MGLSGHFRYVDVLGNAITDTEKLERIRALVIPPAWTDVWISPNPNAKLQATGVDAAGRRQYLYHANYRAQQEQAKFDRLIRFAERLPELRAAAAEHLDREKLDRLRVSAIATRLINAGWFRVGSERYAKESRTYGITTLRKSHVHVRGHGIAFDFVGKHRTVVRTTLVDEELADNVKALLALPGGRRLFRYEWEGGVYSLTGARLIDYVREYLGGERHCREEADSRRNAPRREGARQYARGCAQLIRQSCGDRPVSRRQNDRRFPTTTFTRCARAQQRPRPGRTGPLEPASFLENSASTSGRLIPSALG